VDIHLGHVITPQDTTPGNIQPARPARHPAEHCRRRHHRHGGGGEAPDILAGHRDSRRNAATSSAATVHYPQIVITVWSSEQLLDWLYSYAFPDESLFTENPSAEATAELFTDQVIRNGVTAEMIFSTVHAHVGGIKAGTDADLVTATRILPIRRLPTLS
jgi:guanine deaminase